MMSIVKRFLADESGATAIEYGLPFRVDQQLTALIRSLPGVRAVGQAR